MQGGTDTAFVADVMYYRSALLTAEAARILGKDAEAARYHALAQCTLACIREEYFTATGRCAIPTQTGLALTVAYDLGTNAERAAADLKTALGKSGGKLQTGFVGTPLLCPALTKAGHSDLAFALLLNEDLPGWLYAVKMGATTVWERWNSVLPDGRLSDTGMNSLNHYAYGSIAQWLYGDVAGLRSAEPGFRKAHLCPHISAALGRVELEYRSAAGTWRCGWAIQENGDVAYHCMVPFGCTAELCLPYGGGFYELEAGSYTYTYTPDRPMRGWFSTRTSLRVLMESTRTRVLLEKQLPQITQLPASMAALSLRQLADKMGGRLSAEMLDQLDAALAAL